MADEGQKFEGYSQVDTIALDDVFILVDKSDTTQSLQGTTKYCTAQQIANLVAASSNPAVENSYLTIAAMLADQGNQTEGGIQYVDDASADPTVASGYAFYTFNGTAGGSLSNYTKLSEEETFAITRGARTWLVSDIQDDTIHLTEVASSEVGLEYNDTSGYMSGLLLSIKFTNALEFIIADASSVDYYVKIYNQNFDKYFQAPVTSFTVVNTDYVRANIGGTIPATDEIEVGHLLEISFDIDVNTGSLLEYQTEITTNTTLDGTQKGEWKVYPVNSTTAKTITVTTGDYSANDIINIERRGQGSVEIIADTGVRIRGVRNSENRYFINDVNSIVSILARGSEEFGIIGNLTRGYTGAVTTTSYGTLREGDTAVDVDVVGTGFSSNMLVTVSSNATQSSSFTYVSETEITLHLTAVGSETDTVTVTYDNGDEFVDTDAITIAAPDNTLYASYPFEVGYALFKLRDSITYGIRVRRSSDDAETDVAFNGSNKIALDSTVSAGGDFTTWAGSDDVYVTKRYNQGSTGSTDDAVQTTNANQGQILSSGSLIVNDSVTMIEMDGTNDNYATVGTADRDDGEFTLFTMTRAKSSHVGMIICAATTNQLQLRHESGAIRLMTTDSVGSTTLVTAGTIANDTNYVVTGARQTSNQEVWIDGSSVGTNTPAGTNRAVTPPIRTGAYDGSTYIDGFLIYEIYYKSDEVSNRSAIETLLAAAV